METEVHHEMKMGEASGNLMVILMAQQSRVRTLFKHMVRTLYSDRKNPSARGEESLTVASGKSARGEEVIILETEESVKEAEAALKKEAEEGALLVGMDSTGGVSSMQKQAEEGALLNSTGGEPLMHKEAEEESGKRPERQLYVEIQRALLDIQEKLAKKNWKTDKRTLQLLKDMSNKLDMLDQGGDDKETDEIDDRGELDIDQTCLDTNEAFFEPDKLFLDPLAKEMADEAESFASYSRLWEYKWGKTRGFFTDPSEQKHTLSILFNCWLRHFYLYINGRCSLFIYQFT
jgi:hypothetical protein